MIENRYRNLFRNKNINIPQLIESLPWELWKYIFSYIPPKEVVYFIRTCRDTYYTLANLFPKGIPVEYRIKVLKYDLHEKQIKGNKFNYSTKSFLWNGF